MILLVQPHEALLIAHPFRCCDPHTHASNLPNSAQAAMTASDPQHTTNHLSFTRVMLRWIAWVEMHGDCIVGLTSRRGRVLEVISKI
jgi:hypothetical protein